MAGTIAHSLYGEDVISERHRHRYEFNNAYRDAFDASDMELSGFHPGWDLVEIVELPDHPIFHGFIKAVSKLAHPE